MKIKRTSEDYCVSIIAYGFMILFAVAALFPFLNIIAKTFSEDWAVVSGNVSILPKGFQMDTIRYVLTSDAYLRSFMLSVIVLIVGTTCAFSLTALTAYPLSKKHLPGMKFFLLLCIFTMLFNGGLIPNYLLMRNLKLLNTFPVLILPTMFSAYNMLIIKNYYEALPESIEEAARIDGASNFGVFFKIVAPLSKPVYATIILFVAVAYWNDYFNPMLYTSKAALKTLQLYLRDLVLEATGGGQAADIEANWENMSSEGVRCASIIVSVIPMLIIYPFIQKYFIKGIMIGSVKG